MINPIKKTTLSDAGCQRVCWFVMRDLKRRNTKLPAYKQLCDAGIEVFTPMKWQLQIKQGKPFREEVPLMPDLLFVHSTKSELNPIVDQTSTLQYRYTRGSTYCDPMTVADEDMERFINAVRMTHSPRYYMPNEITPEMCRRRVRIIGGALDGYEGSLAAVSGSATKHLLVELPNFFSVGVEVNPDMVEFI